MELVAAFRIARRGIRHHPIENISGFRVLHEVTGESSTHCEQYQNKSMSARTISEVTSMVLCADEKGWNRCILFVVSTTKRIRQCSTAFVRCAKP
jgi:hypothetical protein